MKKIILDLNKIAQKICEDIENKKWLSAIAKFIALVLVAACVILCLLWLCVLAYQYVDYIIIVVGGTACIIAFFRSLITKKPDKQDITPVQAQQSFIQYDPITLENTYKLVRAGMCYVVGELADIIAVRKPASHSQMDAPTHYDIVSNVPIYHLLVAKTGGMIDTYTITGILQNAIEQKLNNNEFNGISQAVFFYNGQVYPAIMVDKVLDCGNMLQIDIAIASEYYCKYREQRIYNSMNSTSIGNMQDYDF